MTVIQVHPEVESPSAARIFESPEHKYRKSRFVINLVVGSIVMLGVLLSLIFFVLVPQMDARNKLDPNRTPPQHQYGWPPPSYSLLGHFQKSAVTCDHGLCSEIGRDIMIKGGNAVDAAISSLLCLGITNPQSSGIGGGFMMTLYNRTTQKCLIIDARETAPAASNQTMFGDDEWASKYGWRAIATPGEIYGYWEAFKRFGSRKVTWKEIIEPAIQLARNGVPISEYLGYVLKVKEKHFRTLPTMQEWINPKTDHVYEIGDIIKRPVLADTLEKIADSSDPVELFYHSDMTDEMVKEIQENGGIITKKDFANYKPNFYEEPLMVDKFYKGYSMCGPPPPSSFAVTQSIVSVMVDLYANHSISKTKAGSIDDLTFYHSLIEAQKFAYAQRTLLGDASFVPKALALAKNMTTREYTKWIVSRMSKEAQPSAYYGGIAAQKEDHGTSHVSVVDSEGNGVSATSTVNRWFGAVVQSPKFAIVWNDEMDDFSTPGMTNGFGFAPSETNFIEPGKRPMSSMSPLVIFDSDTGKLKMVMGASGGSKIISALAKPIIRVLCFNETIKEAIDAPTLHNQFTPDITQYEPSVPKQLISDLETYYKQSFKLTTGFEGIAQGIVINDDGQIYANGDYRRKSNQHPEGF